MTPTHETPAARLMCLARKTHVNMGDLLILARNNDPFNCGAAAQVRAAEWFVAMLREARYTSVRGTHLRRVHYRILSIPDARRPDGRPYLNDTNSWHDTCVASKFARHLGLVDLDAFIDQRNPDPQVFASPRRLTLPEPDWRASGFDTRGAARSLDISPFALPSWYTTGYDYDPADQPYHVEVWIEKTTMDAELAPVCRRLGVHLVSGAGFQSITATRDVVSRATHSGKPARAFYIADFDPAGMKIPTAVARHG